MKKLVLAALLATFAAGASAADKISFGVSATYPPFESLDASNQIVGFDIDLAKALCKQMQADCTFTNHAFDSLIPSLKFKKYDEIIDHGVTMAQDVAAWVDGHNTLELVMKPQLASVLFRFRPEAAMDDAAIALLNQKIGDALLESGRANVGVTEHNGITCLKLTLLNPTVTLEDVKVLLSLVERTALEILAK
jgi:hypothetical protein